MVKVIRCAGTRRQRDRVSHDYYREMLLALPCRVRVFGGSSSRSRSRRTAGVQPLFSANSLLPALPAPLLIRRAAPAGGRHVEAHQTNDGTDRRRARVCQRVRV